MQRHKTVVVNQLGTNERGGQLDRSRVFSKGKPTHEDDGAFSVQFVQKLHAAVSAFVFSFPNDDDDDDDDDDDNNKDEDI